MIDSSSTAHLKDGVLVDTDSWILAGLRSSRATVRNRAWLALYEQHVDHVFRLVACLGVAWSDAEDVIQQVFSIAHRRLGDDARVEIEHPRAWLCAINVRVVRDHRAWHRVRRLKRGLLEALCLAEATPSITPEQAASASEEQALVWEVLDRMSPKLRDVLVLTELEECKPSEAAELLGISVNTVRSRRRLARAEFRRLWPRVCPSRWEVS